MSNKLNSIRDKEAKESYETDKQRTSNIKEAGIIGKRFFLVHMFDDLYQLEAKFFDYSVFYGKPFTSGGVSKAWLGSQK